MKGTTNLHSSKKAGFKEQSHRPGKLKGRPGHGESNKDPERDVTSGLVEICGNGAKLSDLGSDIQYIPYLSVHIYFETCFGLFWVIYWVAG